MNRKRRERRQSHETRHLPNNFSDDVPLRDVEESLLLAVLATESLHGRSLVRLDASFCLDEKKRACAVDAGTEVGRHIARIFTGCKPHGQKGRQGQAASHLRSNNRRNAGNLHAASTLSGVALPP